jgi:hypothetical protein
LWDVENEFMDEVLIRVGYLPGCMLRISIILLVKNPYGDDLSFPSKLILMFFSLTVKLDYYLDLGELL